MGLQVLVESVGWHRHSRARAFTPTFPVSAAITRDATELNHRGENSEFCSSASPVVIGKQWSFCLSLLQAVKLNPSAEGPAIR